MKITKPFMSGGSQTVRIPQEYRFDMDEELYVNKIGESVVFTPKKALKQDFRQSLSMFPDDSMSDGRLEEASNEKRNEGAAL